ncbi:hypothetical protein [Chelativorans intermedius]|uniref:LPXTG cell wall anchor domain-containing protein n=1 Tax=Chelativorans intermedius TaxID=515947 RepID=A0ABV6D8W7_9HYPH|nr:hypothetical protein [Chelativorans intermedius]MCT8997750.1 hypothetical protein [Chelativorans intermedius]
MKENREAAVAAALILVGFGLTAFFLPHVMLVVGDISTVAAAGVAVLFVAGFFVLFWLRARSQRRKGR